MPILLCGTITAEMIHLFSLVMRQFRARRATGCGVSVQWSPALLPPEPYRGSGSPPRGRPNGCGRSVGNRWHSLVAADGSRWAVLNESDPAMAIGGVFPPLDSGVLIGARRSRRMTFVPPARLA